MSNSTAQQWLHWASGPPELPPPAEYPPRSFLNRLKTPPPSYNSEKALARISANAEDYALSKHPEPDGHAAWLQAVILAHRLFNAEHGQGAYGWSITAASDAMYELLQGAFQAPRKTATLPSRPQPRTPDPRPQGGELMPEKLFADDAFRHAAAQNRQLMRLTMTPAALEHLRQLVKRGNLERHTVFEDTPSPKGAVPSYAATYRGVQIAVHRQMESQFLAEYTDGSLRYHELDGRYRVINEPLPSSP